MSRRLAAIMFTDVVGFTASAQADEAAALSRLREQEGIVRPLFSPFGGREIKSTGDGFLVEFESALKATECAVEIQRRLQERNAREPKAPIQLRIGIHVGDVEEGGGDIFGDAVNVASRVVPLADPGGVCLSDHVVAHVHNKVPYPLERLSHATLKGVSEGLEVYRLVLPWSRASGPIVAGPPLPRIAVLPLTNISPDPKDEYFADGLTEELITVLSQIRGLRVISRTSVNQYKGTTKPVVQIGTELGADSVLEGSVRKVGDQLRIAVQLIDTRSDEHRWAQTYDRKLENVFAIQTEVAERTAGALKVELLKSEREAIRERPTSSLAAYEAYLRGIQAQQRFFVHSDDETDQETVRHFEEAIREDPGFSTAYARLADHLIQVMGETRPADEVAQRARDLATKALELNPNSSEVHMAEASLVWQLDLAWARAEAEFQQAIALNPSNSAARLRYGVLLHILQRWDEAQEQILTARDQDPLGSVPRVVLGRVYEHRGDLPSAISVWEGLAKDFPGMEGIRHPLAWLYARVGRQEEAARLIESAAGAADWHSRLWRATVLVLLGKPEEARVFVADWERGRVSQGFIARYAAVLYAMLGERERALDLLEQDERTGLRALWNVYLDSELDSIRDDPRFVALLRAENLPTTLARPRASSTSSRTVR